MCHVQLQLKTIVWPNHRFLVEYKHTDFPKIFPFFIFVILIQVLKAKKKKAEISELKLYFELNSTLNSVHLNIFLPTDANGLESNYPSDLPTCESLMPSRRY